jgi:dihydrofolate reductase
MAPLEKVSAGNIPFGKPITIIAAMTKSRVIGVENKLPWHLPEDLKLFKQATRGNVIIMGRKTYESIGKPLPGRKNFIVSASAFKDGLAASGLQNNEYEFGKFYYFKSLEDAINASFLTEGNPFVIGGASIYTQALALAKTLHISFVKKEYSGDSYFPEFDLKDWELIEEKDFADFSLNIFNRK